MKAHHASRIAVSAKIVTVSTNRLTVQSPKPGPIRKRKSLQSTTELSIRGNTERPANRGSVHDSAGPLGIAASRLASYHSCPEEMDIHLSVVTDDSESSSRIVL